MRFKNAHKSKKPSSVSPGSSLGGGASSSSSTFSAFTDINKLVNFSNPNPKFCGHYSSRQDILVVGDGNLSFSRALAYSLGGEKIVATVFDSERVFRDKYKASVKIVSELRALNAQVYFGVDATNLGDHPFLKEQKERRYAQCRTPISVQL